MKIFKMPHRLIVIVDEQGGAAIKRGFRKGTCTKKQAAALEALIMGHAAAGIAIGDTRYVEGLESALEGLGNNT